jgi:S1-C subfamily serine protease
MKMASVRYGLISLAIILVFSNICAQPLNDFEEEFIKIIQRVRPCVVKIVVTYKHKEISRTNSGIILDKEGHIITVSRAVKNAHTISVHLHSGQKVNATLVGIDPQTNLAVLKIEVQHISPVEKGLSDRLRVGAFLITIGNPYGLRNSVSTGIVSGLNRCVCAKGVARPLTGLIQTTAPINPGDDGGLVVDSRGRFVGMAFSTLRRDNASVETQEFLVKFLQELEKNGGLTKNLRTKLELFLQYTSPEHHEWAMSSSSALISQGINFVLPSETIYWVAQQIITSGVVDRGWVGLTVKDSETGQGAVITEIVPGSPSAKSDLRAGDYLLSLNNVGIKDSHSLLHQISHLLAGQKIEITFLRDRKKYTTVVTLARMPKEKY